METPSSLALFVGALEAQVASEEGCGGCSQRQDNRHWKEYPEQVGVGRGPQGTKRSPAVCSASPPRRSSWSWDMCGDSSPAQVDTGEARGWSLAHTRPYSCRDWAGPTGSVLWMLGCLKLICITSNPFWNITRYKLIAK